MKTNYIQHLKQVAASISLLVFHLALPKVLPVFRGRWLKFVQEENLKGTFPYLNNITICGKDQGDNNANLKSF